MARKNIEGYPTSFGNQRVCLFIHTGPASYTAITNATPPTGGDTVQAIEAGLKYLDALVCPMTSDDGQYIVQAVSINGNGAGAGTAAVPATTMKLRWLTAATGAEVSGGTNLSARTIRLLAIGPK